LIISQNTVTMPATIQDVAVAARVSLATVSKVLNNRYDVAPETVELVEDVIRRVGYERAATRRGRPTSALHPPGSSRAQRLKATGIALLIPTTQIGPMQSPLTGKLVHGAEAVARKQGLNFHLSRFDDDGHLPACLDPVQVDGLIVRNTVEDLRASLPAIPTVWIFKLGYTPTPGDLVQPDNELVGEMAARYLLERGHQHLAVLTLRLHHAEAQVRADRFARYARKAGATVLEVEGQTKDAQAIADRLLSESPRVTGLFMPLGDHYLEALYRALLRRGITCSGSKSADIDLISCNNDTTHLRLLDPTLPNIDIRAAEVGQAAAETLLWRIQHPQEHRRCILIEPRLVEPAVSNEIAEED
jgi:LacI family transcriptional regulator